MGSATHIPRENLALTPLLLEVTGKFEPPQWTIKESNTEGQQELISEVCRASDCQQAASSPQAFPSLF